MKSFKKSLKSMIFILLGAWAEKKIWRGELWEISGKDLPPEMFIQRIWDSIGRALGEFLESSGRGFGKLWKGFGRELRELLESSWRALGEVWESSGSALGER